MFQWSQTFKANLDTSMASSPSEKQFQDLEKELSELKVENEALTGWILHDHSDLMETKSRVDRMQDQKRSKLLSKCPLDPLTQRKLDTVMALKDRIESQLEAVNHCLVLDWESTVLGSQRLLSCKKEQDRKDLEMIMKMMEKKKETLKNLTRKVVELEEAVARCSRTTGDLKASLPSS